MNTTDIQYRQVHTNIRIKTQARSTLHQCCGAVIQLKSLLKLINLLCHAVRVAALNYTASLYLQTVDIISHFLVYRRFNGKAIGASRPQTKLQ